MSLENSRGLNIAGALTYPTNEENDPPVPMPEQPRQPRDLQGLLRFAMEASKAEDAPGPSELEPMDEERRRFLRDALKHLSVNCTKEMQEAIKVLSNKQKIANIARDDPLPDDVNASFHKLLDIVEDIDMANDFYALGGFGIFGQCFESDNEEIRILCYTLLGQLCQNNPFCQGRTLELGYFNMLLTSIFIEKGKPLAKCLYAISCASREYEPACAELLAQDGCNHFIRLLHNDEPTVRTKAAFLIRHFCMHYDEAREKFFNYHLIKSIVSLIKVGREDATEPLLDTLLFLVKTQDPRALEQCRDPAVNLHKVLEEHLKHPDLADDRYIEEKDYCELVLAFLFRDRPYQQDEAVASEADR